MSFASGHDSRSCLRIQSRSSALVLENVLFQSSLAFWSSSAAKNRMGGGNTMATRPESVLAARRTTKLSTSPEDFRSLGVPGVACHAFFPPVCNRKLCRSSSNASAFPSRLPSGLKYSFTMKYSTRAPWKNSRYQPSSLATKSLPLLGRPLRQITCRCPRTPKNCF